MSSPRSSELGGKPSTVNPTDAVTKDSTVPFSPPYTYKEKRLL